MKMTRLVAAFAATLVSLALTFTLAPADAAPGTVARSGFGTFAARVSPDGSRVVAHGDTIGWGRKIVLIQRRKKSGGAWVTVARPRTDGRGRFSARLRPGRDIPCTGAKFFLRAKKAHRASAQIYKKRTFYCS